MQTQLAQALRNSAFEFRPKSKQFQLVHMALNQCEHWHNLQVMAGSGWVTQFGIGMLKFSNFQLCLLKKLLLRQLKQVVMTY